MQKFNFRNHHFDFQQGHLDRHENLMPCVIIGRRAPVRIASDNAQVEAEVVCIRPNVSHTVDVAEGGADVVYLDGLRMKPTPDAAVMGSDWRGIGDAFTSRDGRKIADFRKRLAAETTPPDQSVMQLVQQIYVDPFRRLTQTDLAAALGMERTLALRHFKATTDQTFRKFKIWGAIVAATHLALSGEKIGLAGVSAGFSDAAHLTRTAATVFGVTPTHGLSKLSGVISLEGASSHDR